MEKLNTVYELLKTEVAASETETSPTIQEATSLLEKREQVASKQSILSIFKARFIMTEDEIVALTSTAEPVDDHFFMALSKAKLIINDCELLLGFENQTFGLDLMEQTSKNVNFGFQKLYKWIQREFKTLNLENPQMNSSIRQALRVLAERPSLFQNCLDFFAEARERILSEAFQVALTGTSSSGTNDPSTKPIDLAAHDPLRYAGDMLAWVHSAAVSEREALEVLFVAEGEEIAKGLKSGRDAEVWRLVADEDEESEFNALRALSELVDKDLSGAANLLRQRVEQVIQTNEETILAYKLATLLSFYSVTFAKLLGSTSNLLGCIYGLESEASRQFRSLIKDSIAAIQPDSLHVSTDLAPPAFLRDALDHLGAIMQTYDSSLSASECRESEFEPIMADALDPFLSGCDNMAKSMHPLESSIFSVNYSLAAVKCLAKFSFTKKRTSELRQNIRDAAAKVIEDQYAFFRVQSGLEPAVISKNEAVTTISPYINEDVLRKASQQLDEFLPSALMDAAERIKDIQDTALARQITEEAAEMFCKDFGEIERVVDKMSSETAAGDTGTLRAVFPRTSADIRVLLS